jgi:hypothetical protein
MNDELERIWKETVMAAVMYPSICTRKPRKASIRTAGLRAET